MKELTRWLVIVIFAPFAAAGFVAEIACRAWFHGVQLVDDMMEWVYGDDA